jgi:GntR family transcriptional regulator
MQFRIDKQSEVPVRDQLRQQIIFLIGIGQLAIGAEMPSVRQLARRLKIHHNTVSQVYSQLAVDGWLEEHRGARLTVGRRLPHGTEQDTDLDDLIDRVVRLARKQGESLQQLTSRLRDRLLSEPADHFLLVVPELDLGELMKHELREGAALPADVCVLSTLQQNPSLAIGAVVAVPAYILEKLDLRPRQVVIPLTYSPADSQLAAIRRLSRPSIIAVISISDFFLRTANGLLGSSIGNKHSFHQLLIRRTAASGDRFVISRVLSRTSDGDSLAAESLTSADLRGIDLLFCDSVAHGLVKHSRKVAYRLISDSSLSQIREMATSLHSATRTAAAPWVTRQVLPDSVRR